MDSAKQHVLYGLRNITQFQGRDTKQQFVPYLVFCFLCSMVLMQIVMIPTMMQFFSRARSAEFLDVGDMMRRNALIAGLFGAAFVALAAAAIARRLRDTTHSAFWGLLPIPPFVVSGFAMSQIGARSNQPDLGYFVISFAATAVYLLSVPLLLFLLTRPSHYPPPAARSAQAR